MLSLDSTPFTKHRLLDKDGGGGRVTYVLVASSAANYEICKLQHNSNEPIVVDGGGGADWAHFMVCIHQHHTEKASDQLMELWAISIGRTGGKVCCGAQSVQLALISVQQSPGRLTDERSEGCNSSCSPPCLTHLRHAEMKCQLISSVESCWDSSFVNVWTRMFKHRHLASLWLLSFSLRDSFFFFFTNFTCSPPKPPCRAHPAHTPHACSSPPDTLLVTLTFPATPPIYLPEKLK